MIKINGKQARVCIDPGHGGEDPGAVGPTQVHEADIALKISKELMFQLDELGIDSHLTRTENVGLKLSDRTQAAKGDHCFISIHMNSFSTPAATGIETIYSAKGGQHKALANLVQQAMMKVGKGHKDRGIKMSPSPGYPRSLYVLSMAEVPSCLVECEFLSNPDQEKWLSDPETQKSIAYGLAGALKSFIMSLPGVTEEGGQPLMVAKAAEVAKQIVASPEEAMCKVDDDQDKIQERLASSISEPSNEVEKIEQPKSSGLFSRKKPKSRKA